MDLKSAFPPPATVLNEEVIMSEKTLKGNALIGNKRWTIILPAVFIMYTI